MLTDYLQLNSSGHFVNQPDHYTARVKPMDYLFIWVLAGKGFGVTEGQRVDARPGHLLTFLPGKPHEYGSDRQEPWDIVWVHFSGKLAREFGRAIRRDGRPQVDLGLDPELRDRWVELVLARSPVRRNTGLYALLGMIVDRLERQPAETTPLDVHRLLGFIHHHIAEKITLERLAREVNLSVPHFVRVFKQQFGVSPMYYVIQKRVALACSLLSETRAPLKQIAASVGCADPFYFSRLFKKTMGVSPSAYRERDVAPND